MQGSKYTEILIKAEILPASLCKQLLRLLYVNFKEWVIKSKSNEYYLTGFSHLVKSWVNKIFHVSAVISKKPKPNRKYHERNTKNAVFFSSLLSDQSTARTCKLSTILVKWKDKNELGNLPVLCYCPSLQKWREMLSCDHSGSKFPLVFCFLG